MAHTPGPWDVRECHEGRLAIGAPYQWPEGEKAWASVATTPGEGVGPLSDQRAANAHLIAAAPELKDALIELGDAACGAQHTDPDSEEGIEAWLRVSRALDSAAKAIAKAEGR